MQGGALVETGPSSTTLNLAEDDPNLAEGFAQLSDFDALNFLMNVQHVRSVVYASFAISVMLLADITLVNGIGPLMNHFVCVDHHGSLAAHTLEESRNDAHSEVWYTVQHA